MRLKPLKQWLCDTCHQVIDGADKGYLEWLFGEDGRNYGFRIVHHGPSSPRHPRGDCYRYRGEIGKQDLDLGSFVGEDGRTHLLWLLHPGPVHAPDMVQATVRDIREWTEIFRRLQVPYYEEARHHLASAWADGYTSDWSQVLMYLPRSLKEIIKHSREEE